MSWLSKATGIHINLAKRLPSNLSMVLANAVPGGSLIGSAINHSIKQDALAGAENTPLALAGTHALGNGTDTPAGGGSAGDAGGAAGGAGGGASSIPGWVLEGIKSGVPAAIQWIKDNAGSIVQGATVAEAVYRQLQADKYAKQGLQLGMDSYNERSPLRQAGLQGMLNPGARTPDLSALRGLAGPGSGNPFAKGLPMAGPSVVGNHGLPPTPQPLPIAGALPSTPGVGNPLDTRPGRIAQAAGLVK